MASLRKSILSSFSKHYINYNRRNSISIYHINLRSYSVKHKPQASVDHKPKASDMPGGKHLIGDYIAFDYYA